MTAFAQVSGLWKRYAAVFRGGRGQGELSEALARAEPWMTPKGPPADADAEGLTAMVAGLAWSLEYGKAVDRVELLSAIADRCGPGAALEAWVRAHAYVLQVDTGGYQPKNTKAVWLTRSPWPVQLIETYELPVFRFLRERVAKATPEERAAVVAAGERMMRDLDDTDVSLTAKMGIAYVVTDRPDWANRLAREAMKRWRVGDDEGVGLAALDVTPYALLGSMDDLALAKELAATIATQTVYFRFIQERVIVERFGEDAAEILAILIEPLFGKAYRGDGDGEALVRMTNAMLTLSSPCVAAFFRKHRAAAMKSKVGKKVLLHLEKQGAKKQPAPKPTSKAPAPPPARKLPERSVLAKLFAMAPPSRHHVSLEGLDEAEEKLQTKFPAEYRELISIYGQGAFNAFLHVHGPSWIVRDGAKLLKGERTVKEHAPELVPDSLFPEKGGLLPIATTDNGNRVFYLTKGAPDAWRVVVFAPRDARHDEYASLQGMLLAWLGWKKPPTVFPDVFDAFPWEDDDGDAKPGAWFEPALKYVTTERLFDAKGTYATRLSKLKKALGEARAIGLRSREDSNQDHLFTERDWRVTLTDDRLIVDHPETDRAWIGGELERLVAAMGGTPL